MREESRTVTLGLGDVSLSPTLGVYYIDMRPARVHYTEDIYGGGFDADGVPMVRWPEGRRYMPVNVAQYGFMLHADWLETRDAAALETLGACIRVLDGLGTETPRGTVWWHDVRQRKYDIPPPWASAMAQGQLMSLYLRMHQATGDPRHLETARGAYRFLSVDVEDGGVRRYDDEGNLWLEEYPSARPSLVLNGFVYALFGLYDLFRVTGDDGVRADIERCNRTLLASLHRYDAGYWSLYDQLKRELVRYYYQKNVHVPQMDVLHRLTGEPLYAEYRDRWARQLTPMNFAFVRLMYRVRPRLDRLRRALRGR